MPVVRMKSDSLEWELRKWSVATVASEPRIDETRRHEYKGSMRLMILILDAHYMISTL